MQNCTQVIFQVYLIPLQDAKDTTTFAEVKERLRAELGVQAGREHYCGDFSKLPWHEQQTTFTALHILDKVRIYSRNVTSQARICARRRRMVL